MDNAIRVPDLTQVQPGTFWKFGGHKIHSFLREEWWKVINREGDVVRLINKTGQTKTMILSLYGLKAFRWVPRSELAA